MEDVRRPKLNKIPGMPLAKPENHAKNVTKLTKIELLEIKEREKKLLGNKGKLNSLPDKGKRIQDFYDKVVAELERRDNIDDAAAMFSQLNIAAKGENALNQLEWNGHIEEKDLVDPIEDVLDSDDEIEMDPLRVIAQRSMHERRIQIIPPEPQLITAEDLAEIKSFSHNSPDSELSRKGNKATSTSESTNSTEAVIDVDVINIDITEKLGNLTPNLLQVIEHATHSKTSSIGTNESSRSSTPSAPLSEIDPHVRYLVDITETQVVPAQREKFKPYQTTISNVHDPDKERIRIKGKHWENTAATPPLIQHGAAKMLTLLDSVEIQNNYLSKLKDLQEKQAAKRLAAKVHRLEKRQIHIPNSEVLKTKTAFTAYRTPGANLIEGDQYYNEDDEMLDPLDEEKPGGVNYTVFE